MSPVVSYLRYSLTDAVDEWRHSPGPNLLAVATMAAVLFVGGINLLLLRNLGAHVGKWKNDLRVSIYLLDAAKPAEVDALYAKVAALTGVSRVDRIDKEEALRRFKASFKDLADVPAALGGNPLPASLDVVLVPGAGSRAAARAIGAAVSGEKAVEEVRYDQDFLDRIDGLLSVARWGGAVLGLVVLTAVAFVVSGVLRLTVYARRDEVDIMHLVGASPMLIRGPFLISGTSQGLAGGLLALFFVELARRTARANVGASVQDLFDLVAGRPLSGWSAAFVVSIGVGLGFVSAWFAVRDTHDRGR